MDKNIFLLCNEENNIKRFVGVYVRVYPSRFHVVMPERSKGADLRSVGESLVGSNPTHNKNEIRHIPTSPWCILG